VIAPKPERPWFPSLIPPAVPALGGGAALLLGGGLLALARRAANRRGTVSPGKSGG
jgi:hypothetical protein